MAEAALAHERLVALRSEIGRLESQKSGALARASREDPWDAPAQSSETGMIASGAEAFDAAIGGGVLKAALHEIRSAATSDNGAASGFALALGRLALGSKQQSQKLLWIADPMGSAESGLPYGPGLAAQGVPPSSLLYARPKHLKDALMVAEAALAVNSFAAVIMEVYGNPQKFGLTESRRLHLRAKAYRRPIFLLRERGEQEASSAVTRFLARPAPACPFILPGGRLYPQGMGNPAFRITIEKSRNPSPPEFLLEWNTHDCLFHELEPGRVTLPEERQTEDSVALLPFPGHRQDRTDQVGAVMALSRAS